MATTTIYVSGREVTYERFINDLAAKLADVMKSRSEMPEYICQRQAFRLFGRANVERWRREGKLTPHRRLRKVEYRITELYTLSARQQDYYND
ncbi:hypothetical protein [uncultured Muribaculum sp.]|uniref:hypothetical protein n=2 Tax=uncultured Muribaculum sp. TaxID=1918613 RepID=UPI0025B332E9|nr:hypothetical protein [uncultured Muribaculum sp.]